MTDTEKNDARPSMQVSPVTVPVASSSTRRASCSSVDSMKKDKSDSPCEEVTQNVLLHHEEDDDVPTSPRPGRTATFIWAGAALTILAWWVTSIVLPFSRHRWIVQSLWAWFFVLTIAFRFVPASVVARPVSAVWKPAVSGPFSRIPFRGRLALAWLAAVGITFGSAFGVARPEGTAITDRVISLIGVFLFQGVIYGLSQNRAAINWSYIPVSIILQQALALFVLKSQAGFDIFRWINTAVADFQTGAIETTALFFDVDTAQKNWFFVSGLAVFLFFTAWVQMLYHFNWMQWLTKQFAWFGQKVLGASGVETFVALWSPWFGQGNSAVLVGPYIDSTTDSELFAIMATSLSSISSLMIGTYTTLGLSPRSLIAQSAMVIPASIVNAKMAFPEAERNAPVTRSRASTVAHRKKLGMVKAGDWLEAFMDGAWVGLHIVGRILSGFFTVLALLVFINGILIWIFRGFGVHKLDLHQVVAWPLYPFAFFLGVPRGELYGVAYLLSGKLLVSSDFAYAALGVLQGGEAPLSARAYGVLTFALANTANIGSLGIQIGVLNAFTSRRKHLISKVAVLALLVATFTTLQTAAIAGSIL